MTLAVGMPANERMDALVEKATELGVAAIQPLVCDRSVLRLAGERALRKPAHWQAVAVAACEQCGRDRLPAIGGRRRFEPGCASSCRRRQSARCPGLSLRRSPGARCRPPARSAPGDSWS